MKTDKLLNTTDGWAPLVLRLGAGVVMWPHGAQFLLGLFGGGGFEPSMDYLTGMQHLPWLVAFMVIMIQFFGALMLLAGLLTRVAALGMFGLAIGMMCSGHLEHGFFMNWMGNAKGEGIEFHLLLLAICAALVMEGGGRFSVDRKITVQQ